jgi:hypothetical protein
MDAHRFDALTRLIGSRTSRRVAVGVAATGLLSLAVPDAEAARCSKSKPCPECKKCKKHKCKPDATQNRAACSASTGTCVNGTCTSAVCPAGAQFCTDEPNIPCGSDCYCVTGKSRGTICGGPFSSAPCAPCEADADCDEVTGPGSVCLDVEGECFCDTGPVFPTACMPPCPG